MAIDITKMTSKGQVVIPQDIREKVQLEQGDKFLVYDLDGNIILKRVKNLDSTDGFAKLFDSMHKEAKKRGIRRRDISKEINAYRND